MSITSAWEKYFQYPHEGLGTTYERFILHQYFERIRNRYSIQTIIEVPSFGMTGISGINSIWWAKNGARVTVMDDDIKRVDLIREVWDDLFLEASIVYQQNECVSLPFEDDSFDLGWNFAALSFVPELEALLKELTRVTRKVVFICIPNRLNVFYILRLMAQKNSDKVYPNNINPVKIKQNLLKLKWQVEEQGYLDVPPWPDIAMKKEDLLHRIGLRRLAKRLKNKEENYISILDYFSGRKKDMDKEILKYAFLENSPTILKRFWAHHQYLVFTPK
ncbi:MAG: methyltransferase domain-containing protein [Candidatus Aenigmarchaeota archaeon]|nr:methyltransferase domain-containing protein [Candidatus Aenigmarchaeota archaeon]